MAMQTEDHAAPAAPGHEPGAAGAHEGAAAAGGGLPFQAHKVGLCLLALLRAEPGKPLLEIEQAGEYQLEAAVPESLIATLRAGQQVGIEIEALGDNGPTEGRIAQIDPAGDAASRSFVVKVSLGSPAGLRSGLYGRMLVPGGERSGLSVPSSAVASRGQIQSVFTVEDATARLRLVTLGELIEGRYEVLSGLAAGDRVVLDPSGLSDGSPVEESR